MPISLAQTDITQEGGSASLDVVERTFAIEGITCAACVQTIEDGLVGTPGVLDARVNYSTKRLHLRMSGGVLTASIVERLRKQGYRIHPLRKLLDDEEQRYSQWLLRCVAVSGFAAMNVMLLSISVWSGNVTDITTETRDFFHWLSALIVMPAVGYAGQPFFRSAFEALAVRHVNMDVPISLGIVLALGLSLFETATHGIHAYFESAIMLLFFLLVGRYLEQVTRQRMRNAAHNISSLRAITATRIDNKRLVECEVDDLRPGNVVLVRPGDRFPTDGVILEGAGSVDCSIATGETAGTRIASGSTVLAGTMSIDGSFHVRVKSHARNSFIESLERLIDTAVNSRMPYMQIANRAARLYAPVVHMAALLTLIGWLLVGAGLHDAIVASIAVLIITCPCALALAVPTVQVVAMGELFRANVIANSPDLTERLAQIDTVVFDKTGTLTLPEASVCNSSEIPSDLQSLAARLAAGSKHPLARAVGRLDSDCVALTNVAEEAGRGVRAVVDGMELRLGSASFCNVSDLQKGQSGNTSSIYFRAGDRVAEFWIGQEVRDHAAEVTKGLKSKGYKLIILSGDRPGPVEFVSRNLGIDEWRANCTPEQKIATLRQLQQEGRKVLMVGDGLNDAPALAAAYVSISPISAADLTQTHADGMFLGDSLRPLYEAIDVSLKAKATMVQNLGLAFVYNIIAIPLAVSGFVTPLVAAAAMSCSSILVSINALRVRHWRRDRANDRRTDAIQAAAI
ncbi:MAG: cadmium-translocating P-type ATPase [Xanthobacteraceae bacterium]|nr:cadmium-translocating P-type ATPase [Xanthobacteraceae bacterium]